MTYITNNCGNLSFYFSEHREYDHPFIGCLFVNDNQYIKFCKNFEYYCAIKPIFGLPAENSLWCSQNKGGWYKHDEILIPYPVMYLNDIEIHWIHEKSEAELLEKYNRRLQRDRPNPIFMLSDGDLMNDFTKKERQSLLTEFMSIPTSIYLTKHKEDLAISSRVYLIDRWVGHKDDRNSSHVPLIHTVGDRVVDYKDIIYNRNPFK